MTENEPRSGERLFRRCRGVSVLMLHGCRTEVGNMLSDEESSGPEPYILQVNVNDRSEKERHDLREEKTAYYGYAESPSRFRSCAKAQRDR